jgi:hypothetical protein
MMRSRLAKITLASMLVLVLLGVLLRGCAKSTPPRMTGPQITPLATTSAAPAQLVFAPTVKPKAKWAKAGPCRTPHDRAADGRPRTFEEVRAATDPEEIARLERGERYDDPAVADPHQREVASMKIARAMTNGTSHTLTVTAATSLCSQGRRRSGGRENTLAP